MSERARAGFAQALEGHPFSSVEALERETEGNSARVWSGRNADVFVRMHMAEQVCEMGPVAGDLSEMLGEMLPAIEHCARFNGCREMWVQAGREGWARTLAPYGYEVAAVILRKVL